MVAQPVFPATQEAEAGELPEPREAEVAVSRDRAICTPAWVTRAKFHLKKKKRKRKQSTYLNEKVQVQC